MSNPQVLDLQFTTVQEPVPDFIYDELREYVRDSNAYHAQPPFLRQALGKEHNVPADWIYLTSGVDEIIRLAVQSFGSSAHIFTPTEYTTFKQFSPDVHSHYVLEGNDYVVKSETIPGATLIWLANPNNPVGYTDPSTILDLANNNPEAIVVVDEIYSEYAPQLSVVSAVSATPNLAVCRGFSKTYGMAGIRLGYIVANPVLLKAMQKLNPWANVAYPSCGMAAIALEHKDYYQQLRKTIIARKEALAGWLTAKDLVVVPSFINTIVLRLSDAVRASMIVDQLSQRGILINSSANQDDKVGLPDDFVSFVVGTDEQIDQLKTSLSEIL